MLGERVPALVMAPPPWLKLVAGVLAIWPLTVMVGMAVGELVLERDIFSVWAVLSGQVALLLFIFDAALSGRVPQEKRYLWVVVLILGNMIAVIFYWYFYVLRQQSRPSYVKAPNR